MSTGSSLNYPEKRVATFSDPFFGEALAANDEVSRSQAYLFILSEHKSSPESWVAWQFLKYKVRIWDDLVQAEANRRKKKGQKSQA